MILATFLPSLSVTVVSEFEACKDLVTEGGECHEATHARSHSGAGLWLTRLTGDCAQADDCIWSCTDLLLRQGFHGREAADGDRFSQ